jgi:hypothetical protein
MMVQATGQTAQPGAQRKHQTPQSVSRAAVDSKLLAVRIRVERSAGSEAKRIEIKCIQTESIEAGNIAAQIIEAENIDVFRKHSSGKRPSGKTSKRNP